MKKTLITCLVAVVALFAIASSANAIICTVDQRPAATLLVPYFQAAFNPDGSVTSGAGSLDTIVTIGNASSAPMLAHVSIYNERSTLVLDFNVALTGFDVQAMSMSSVLSGNLPVTPVLKTHVPAAPIGLANDPCERNPLATPSCVAPCPAVAVGSLTGFMRIRPACTYVASGNNAPCPANAGDQNDPSLATTQYPTPAWPPGGSFAASVLSSLDSSPGSNGCNPPATGPTFPLSGVLRGYVVIDHVNYCTLSNPDLATPNYFYKDAIGNENNLFGEVIFTSGSGVPTFGVSTVNIEASKVFSNLAGWTGANAGSFGAANGAFVDQTDTSRLRTFYARAWAPSLVTSNRLTDGNTAAFATGGPWNQGFGDEREPLGLKFATRYFEATSGAITSFFRVWRASAGLLGNLQGSLLAGGTGVGPCTAIEPSVNLSFFDEDENPVAQAGTTPCPSPCTVPPPSVLNFPLETQRQRAGGATGFTLPPAYGTPSVQVGWMSASFVNLGSAIANYGGLLDQAWMDYEFTGASAFFNASIPGTQLDPSTCHPLLIPLANGAGINIVVPDALTNPVTPGSNTGLLANPATATGP